MVKSRVARHKVRNRDAYFALSIAVLALIINFWAWSLLSPLGVRYGNELSLSAAALSFLLAIPVIVGSLGRIILGIAADRFGGKLVFGLTSLVTAIPVCALAFSHTYEQLIIAAVLLGIGGATFAIGVPFISTWFPPKKRGLMLGLYSMGNVGTAISGLLTPQLDALIGRQQTFFVVALSLVVIAMVFLFRGKNAPGWKPVKKSAFAQLVTVTRNRVTWDLAILYVITFGAIVAFGVYLPVLLKVAYSLSIPDAAARAAGFVLVATFARPLGGWLSDLIGGGWVVKIALFMVTILACTIAFQPTLALQTTAAYLGLAFVLGCGNGAIIALLGKMAGPGTIGTTMGIVGAMGGLGGFLPPLILGFSYQQTHSYALAFILLAVSAFTVFLYISKRLKAQTYVVAHSRIR